MWERIITAIKRFLKMDSKDIKALQVDAVTSEKMVLAIEEWLDAFYNSPAWNKDKKLYQTNFAGIITAYVATLSASELSLNTGSGERAEYVKDQLERFFMGNIRNHIQKAAAGGWVALKPWVNGNDIICDVVAADNFFATKMHGGVVESAVFIDEGTSSNKKYIRLEYHELTPAGVVIKNEVYPANDIREGRSVPLDTVPEWADLLPEATIEGTSRPLFTILKMPFSNQIDPQSPLPASFYANAMDSLCEIDRIYTEFLWEIKTGRRKQILDMTAVTPAPANNIPVKGGVISSGERTRREVVSSDQYLVLNMGNKTNTKPFDDYTPEMRIEAYQTALNIQLRLLESQCGLSAETFSFDLKSGNAKTATEVASEDNSTFSTIKGIQDNGLEQGLMDLVYIYDFYATLYALAPAGSVAPGITFGDSVFEDTDKEFIRLKSLADNGYISKEYLVAWYLGVDEAEAKKMIPQEDDTKQDDFLFGS